MPHGRARSPLFAFALLLHAATARADAPSADRVKSAAEEFDAGRRAYQTRDYEAAAAHFEAADRDAPSAVAIRNAIRAHNDAKNLARAATLSASMLVRYPDDKASVSFAKQTLASHSKKLHRLDIQCEPACTLLVDGKLSPLPEGARFTVFVDPGKHKLSAGWSKGRHRDQEIQGEAGKDTPLSFSAPPLPPPPPPPAETPPPPPPEPPPAPASKKPLKRPFFYASAGLTAVLGGVTVWSTIDMRSNPGREKVRSDCAGRDESCPTYQRALQSQTRTNVLLGVTAGAAVVTGVVAYFTDWSRAAPTEARVMPTLQVGGREGWSLGAQGVF